MGTNFPDFLLEANRVLKFGGTLFIAEVLSRFEDVKEFSEYFMPKAGFVCVSLSRLKDFFYMMVFKKNSEVYSLR
jgi:ribosomal RNA-processing protein 8